MKKPKRINSVSVTLFVMFALFAYSIWAFVPVMWPLWQMSGIMRTACAQAYSLKDDDKVLKGLVKDARRTRLRVKADNFIFQRVPYTDEELGQAANPTMREYMTASGKECIIRFRYVDRYQLPLVGFEYELPYESKVSLSLRRDEKSANTLNDFFYNSCTCTSVPGAREAR